MKNSSTHSLAPYTEALAVVCLGGWGRNPAGSVCRVSAQFKQKPEGQREVNLYNGKLLWTGPLGSLKPTSFLSKQLKCFSVQFSSLSRVRLFATPWTAVHQASLSITNSQSLLKLMSTESVMPSNHITISCFPASLQVGVAK